MLQSLSWRKYCWYLLRLFCNIFTFLELLKSAHQKTKHPTIPRMTQITMTKSANGKLEQNALQTFSYSSHLRQGRHLVVGAPLLPQRRIVEKAAAWIVHQSFNKASSPSYLQRVLLLIFFSITVPMLALSPGRVQSTSKTEYGTPHQPTATSHLDIHILIYLGLVPLSLDSLALLGAPSPSPGPGPSLPASLIVHKFKNFSPQKSHHHVSYDTSRPTQICSQQYLSFWLKAPPCLLS